MAAIQRNKTYASCSEGHYSSDISNVESYHSETEDNFGFVLRASVGPMGEPGEESFDITVCTPKWLMASHGPSEILLGLHKIIVFKYDYAALRRFIETNLMRCSGDTWTEAAQKVSLLGQWEFEGYRPKP